MKRRTFIKNSGLTISALPILPALHHFKTYRIALIGSGWWGMNILREAIAHGNCKVVALCDVDKRALDAAKLEVDKLTNDRPKIYEDYRDLLAKEKVDIAIIGTPDHWHALPAIAAIKAGAHLYLEKPIGHTIGEGRAILNTARKYGKTVQVGTHRRVSPHNIMAMDFLRSGMVGKVHQVKCFVNYNWATAGQKVAPTAIPEGLNWDMWLGPAPYREYAPGIHPKGFRQYLDFANGQIGDWGIHWFDQILWWTDEKYPKTIYSTGNRFVKADNTDAPDAQLAIFQFENFTLQWEHKLFAKNENEGHNIGCYFYGTKGTLHLGWLDGWSFYPKNKNAEVIHQKPTLNTPDQQNIKELWADFMQAIEKNKLPLCDIEKGHLATNISHLGMISYKLGRSIHWDGLNEKIIDDVAANALLKREYRGDWEYPQE
ncbi:MAG: Gfo/Idh/MocA family protein [Saprospiraceae bacterium]